MKSIGRIWVETCNNCLSVVVIQRRDCGEQTVVRTEVEMKDSAYDYVK